MSLLIGQGLFDGVEQQKRSVMELYHPEAPGSNTSVLLCLLTPPICGNRVPIQQLISKEKPLIKPLNKVV